MSVKLLGCQASDEMFIQQIYHAAFAEEERASVCALALDLLAEQSEPETVSLLAFEEDVVLGHVAFSPIFSEKVLGWRAYILAPLAVKPERQKSGIGRQLVNAGIERLRKQGVHTLFVYGDPAYYGRFGFEAKAALEFIPPHQLQYPFGWQALTLNRFEACFKGCKLCCVAALNKPELW